MHKPIRTILYIEAALNTFAVFLCLAAPSRFIALFSDEPAGAIAEAFVRWYGVLLIVLTIIMVRALRNGSIEALRPVVQAYLIGDVLHLAALWSLVSAVGAWTFGSIAVAVVSVIFGLVRVYALFSRMDLLANLHPAAAPSNTRRKTGD